MLRHIQALKFQNLNRGHQYLPLQRAHHKLHVPQHRHQNDRQHRFHSPRASLQARVRALDLVKMHVHQYLHRHEYHLLDLELNI